MEMKKTILCAFAFSMLFAFADAAAIANNVTTTTTNVMGPRYSSDDIKCYKCSSLTHTGCGVQVYRYINTLPMVYCSDDCYKWVMVYDGITEVRRGCSTGAEVNSYTCDSSHCNNGLKFYPVVGVLLVVVMTTSAIFIH